MQRVPAYNSQVKVQTGGKSRYINHAIFIFVIVVYIVGQFLIGTYQPNRDKFIYNAPADSDFLYYAAIADGVFNGFPPQNPAFYGEKLTQPFLQYYPVGILSKITNPYNAIRILNVVYLVLFGLLLMKLFPENFGAAIVILFAGSSFGVTLNALGIDLISRGFTHAPFFLLLTYAMFGKEIKLRVLSVFLCAFINGYMMLMVIPSLAIWFVWEKKREVLFLAIAGLVGLILAALFVSSAASEKPFYFVLTESFRFAPFEIFKHAIPAIIFAALFRQIPATILLAVALIFGSFFHYNPFFPIFTIYFATAIMIVAGFPRFMNVRSFVYAALVLLFFGFVIEAWQKFDPGKRAYYPRVDERLNGAETWIRNNTKYDTCFLAVTADESNMALIMEYRPVYLGAVGHLAHLGLNWKPRYDEILRTFAGGPPPEIVNYIFYGPVERKLFPNPSLNFPIVYEDRDVSIYRTE